ncbi:MAG: cytochrome c biogenesis protein ResB [Deltaproteobacteria bacterium]|nr:cytochrome c biogenesis protein ResB [Deltaproteobacteria bacterium]
MRRLINTLGSRRLTAYLVLTYAAFLVLLFVWAARIPAAVVGNISRTAPFICAYIAAAIHLVCCLMIFLPATMQRTSLSLPADDPGEPVALPDARAVEAAAWRARLPVRWIEPGKTAVLHRNRWSPLGSIVFHTALLLIPVAVAVSLATRVRGEAWVVESHAFEGTRAEYVSVEPAGGFESRAPRVRLEVLAVDAAFWGDRLFFTDLRALVAAGGAQQWMTLPGPVRIDGARVTLRGFNYTPSVEISGPDGRTVHAGDLNLRLFPPGNEDSFTVPSLPHRIFVRLYPDSSGPQARPINRGMGLAEPLLHVAVTLGKRLAAHGWLRPGEALAFDGHTVAFPRILKGGDIVVHRDWGYPILWMALVLSFAGLIMRVCFPSYRAWVLLTGEGARLVVRADPFATPPRLLYGADPGGRDDP